MLFRSLLTGRTGATVVGLDAVRQSDWPSVRVVHGAFDLMVASGMAMLTLAVMVGWFWWRRRPLADQRWLLRAMVAAGPLGFVAIEAGWVVTEVGRQPWVIYGVLRTADAVTPMPWLVAPFTAFSALYVFLAFIVVALLRRLFRETAGSAPEPSSKALHG